ncbi:hypothetical protein [Kitasatospora sp. NPDC056273]|uniref:hypothetical protein n=1 Tax=Kitasatospora sp. NPDC056273 TaxID=3345769 RepID=UPI0035DD49E2
MIVWLAESPFSAATDSTRGIAAGIPLAVVSKTLRHSNLAITVDLYGHLLKDSADEAVKALSAALDRADAQCADRISGSVPDACLAA